MYQNKIKHKCLKIYQKSQTYLKIYFKIKLNTNVKNKVIYF